MGQASSSSTPNARPRPTSRTSHRTVGSAAAPTVPATPDSSPFAIGLLLRQAHENFSAAMDDVLRPFDLERRHLMVLMRLDADGALSQRDLVSRTHHDKSSMVRIVDDLERAGLASREPVRGDRRVRAVTLTDQGRRTLSKVSRVAKPAATAAMQPLKADEVTQLRRLLQRLTAP